VVDLVPEAINSCVLGAIAEVLEGASIAKSIGYERHYTVAITPIVFKRGVPKRGAAGTDIPAESRSSGLPTQCLPMRQEFIVVTLEIN
jgi:hypothetical protein